MPLSSAPLPSACRWRFTLLIVLTLALAALLPARPAPAQADAANYDLRPHFVAGRTIRYSFWTLRTRTATTSVAPGQSASTTEEINGEATWTVARVQGDGSAVCTLTLDWITLALTMPDGVQQQIDSRRPAADDPTGKLLSAMSGTPLQVHVSADGSVAKVEGVQRIAARAGADVPTPDELDFIETASDLVTLPGAPGPLSAGGTWQQDFLWNREPGKLKAQTRYRLAGVSTIAGIPIASVTATSALTFEPDLTELPANAPPLTVRMIKGSLENQILFDLWRHEAVGRNSTESRTTQITIRLPQQTVTRTVDEFVQGQVLRIAE